MIHLSHRYFSSSHFSHSPKKHTRAFVQREKFRTTVPTTFSKPLIHQVLEKAIVLLKLNRFDINEKLEQGKTLLHLAVEAKNRPFCKMLLQLGADINTVCDTNGYTPLHRAVLHKDLEIVKLLLERGANPNKKDRICGSTPLHYAASMNCLPIYKALLAYGADRLLTNSDHNTPFVIALQMNARAIVDAFPNGNEQEKQKVLEKVLFHLVSQAPVSSRGAHYQVMHAKVSQFVTSFAEEFTLPNLYRIGKAFSDSSTNYFNVNKAYELIHSGKMSVIPIGWKKHAIVLFFYKDQMVICNRGDNPLNAPSIVGYPVDRSKVTISIVYEIVNASFQKTRQEAADYYYKTLPQLLLDEKGSFAILPSIKSDCPNTCTMSSTKAAIKAAFYLLFADDRTSYEKYKEWSTWARLEALRQYLDYSKACHLPLNEDLVGYVFSDIFTRVTFHHAKPRNKGPNAFGQKILEILRSYRT